MRPDLRSFSFTWTKGSGGQQDQASTGAGSSRPTTRALATSNSIPNLQSSVLKSSKSMYGGKMKKGKLIDKKELYGCNPSKFKQLKEFGSSLFGHSSKTTSKTEYSTIQEERMTDDEIDDDDIEVDGAPNSDGFDQFSDENTHPAAAEPMHQEVNEDNMDKKSLRSASSKGGIGKKINKTVQDVKSTFGNLSQRLRRSTRRHYRMTTPLTSAESTPTRTVLGRTPTRLYSPFGFVDSPAMRTPARKTPKRLQRPSTPRLPRKLSTPVHMELFKAYSPNNTLQRDLQDIGRGFEEMQVITQKVSRRNLRY